MSVLEELYELEATGKYVFHGSNVDYIEELEPRQPMSHNKPDGKPAVAASEFVDPAIFMAIISSRKAGGWGDDKAGKFGFYIDKDSWARANKEKWRGYIYVLSRADFGHHRQWEWRAHRKVKPIKIVPVVFENLPNQIEVL